ncbi:DUF4232 domain-containing protein [Streptomyces sp. NPDC090108]|uniref:DUF4232 domain-containing protein n=1 Tax=Streptomyces sp. NPDC090108 TaxID=3365947 RepID=UPI00380FE923
MSSIRNLRTRFLTVAATGTLAALSLTACDDGSGVRAETPSAHTSALTSSVTPAPSGDSSSRDDAKSGASGSAQGTQGSSGTRGSSGTSGASGTNVSAAGTSASGGGRSGAVSGTVTCEGSRTRTVAALLTRPVNHMLLTVTNTGGSTCFLYGYPSVRFGSAQSVPPVIEDSKPQAVVTLKPGESGYASVNLSAADGSGAHGNTEKSLTVYFQGRSGTGSTGTGAHPALPAKGVYVDDSVKVTYWQQSMDDAINW